MILCQEEMVQGLRAWGRAAVEVWVADVVWVAPRARVEAEWAARLRLGRAETVSARTAVIMFRTWWVSRATR